MSSDTPHGGFDLSYGRFDAVTAQGYLTGPITDTLSVRVSAKHEYRGPWQTSETRPNDKLGRRDFSAGRILIDWKPSAASHFFHDCPSADHWASLVQPQPVRPISATIRVSTARFGRVPRYYICCDDDRALSPAFQQRMVERTPMQRVFHMGCGHSPFLADPDGLADILADIHAEATMARDTVL